MPIEIEPYTTWDSGWTIRVRPPLDVRRCKVTILLHGWTGDENSMGIFAHLLPRQNALFFPRGPIQAHPDGYGWLTHSQSVRPSISEFEAVAHALLKRITSQTDELGITDPMISVMGFSQGAAFALALASLFPDQIERIAILAGFLPVGISDGFSGRIVGKHFYVAHGIKDKTIPIEEAHQLTELLHTAGAHVTFCESNTGHKLSTACLKGISEFFRQP